MAAVSVHGLWSSLGAGLVMGVAVTGMHCTGTAAVSVNLDGAAATGQSAVGPLSLLLFMLAGPLTVLLIAAVIVMFDPDVMLATTSGAAGAQVERSPPGHDRTGRTGGRKPESFPRSR
ncbi:hypothetical protein [Streptomyces sp. NPDC058335]|uniref:hypothetical protein n=1 Tax=Streptomyces sp. NPDC058335 TaxID=3346451 RepID=UPI00364C64D1